MFCITQGMILKYIKNIAQHDVKCLQSCSQHCQTLIKTGIFLSIVNLLVLLAIQ